MSLRKKDTAREFKGVMPKNQTKIFHSSNGKTCYAIGFIWCYSCRKASKAKTSKTIYLFSSESFSSESFVLSIIS